MIMTQAVYIQIGIIGKDDIVRIIRTGITFERYISVYIYYSLNIIPTGSKFGAGFSDPVRYGIR